MIRPTNGRVVLFHPDLATDVMTFKGQMLAATITHVWSDHMVNLSVFDADGRQWHRSSVTLVQDGDPNPYSTWCEWMPYQKGQAAKVDALTAEAMRALTQPGNLTALGNDEKFDDGA